MLDLRKQVLAAYIKPSDSKEKDFHLALSDYLYKELRKSNLNVAKHNVLLKVSLQNKHQDKYEHIIIDCLEGKLYLRGSEVNDRYFGRLTKFSGGQRASDAYHCAIQSATKIIKRIQEIQDALDGMKKEILGETTLIDMRQKKQTIAKDLRRIKTANIERKDLRKVNKIERKDMRKVANIQRINLRKVNQIERKDMRKVAKVQRTDLRRLKKIAFDISFLNDLTSNLQNIYNSVQNITSNGDIQSILNFIAQNSDDMKDMIPIVKNIKPTIDYISGLINDFQNKAPEVINEIDNVSKSFRYEMIDPEFA